MARLSSAAKQHAAEYNRAWFIRNPEKAAAYKLKSLPLLKRKLREEPAYRAKLMWRAARNRARRDGIEFSVGMEQITKAVTRGICEATGLLFTLDYEGARGPMVPSLDRHDNLKGYTPENTRVVLWALNAACGPWGEEILWDIVKARWPDRVK